jgi:hypothetical protein
VFWTAGSVPEEFTYGHVGYLSTGVDVRLMLDDGQIGSRVAGQSPGIAAAVFVQNLLRHAVLIGLATVGSCARLLLYSPTAEALPGTIASAMNRLRAIRPSSTPQETRAGGAAVSERMRPLLAPGARRCRQPRATTVTLASSIT